MLIISIIIVVIILLVVYMVSIYNDLITKRNKVKNSWAHIDTQLQRRFDLIPNLVEIVKKYTEHEEKILSIMCASRNGYMTASTNKEKLSKNEELSSYLKSLYNIVEYYPELKSSKHFLNLQSALTEIEEDISYARQFYNDAVTIYNNQLMKFPNNIIASKFNFKEETPFDAIKESEITPRISFKEKKHQCPVCGATVSENDINCEYCGSSLI